MNAGTLGVDAPDKRKDPRFLVDDNFQVKILFSSDDPKVLGKTFSCSFIDVSKSGVQIASEHPLSIKSVLDLQITVKDSSRQFSLTGNVKWCKPGTGISHNVGIQLKDRAGTPTDLNDWKTLIKKLK